MLFLWEYFIRNFRFCLEYAILNGPPIQEYGIRNTANTGPGRHGVTTKTLRPAYFLILDSYFLFFNLFHWLLDKEGDSMGKLSRKLSSTARPRYSKASPIAGRRRRIAPRLIQRCRRWELVSVNYS